MALDELLAELRRTADATAAAVRADAEAEVARIRAAAATDSAGRRAVALEGVAAAEQNATALALGEARLAAQRVVLEARTRLLDRVFAAALERARSWSWREEDRRQLAERVSAALGFAGGRTAELCCAPDLEAPVRAAAGPAATVRPDPALLGGFVLQTGDGLLRVDDTLPLRLERQRRTLAQAVMRRVDAAS